MQHFVVACVRAVFDEAPVSQIEYTHLSVLLGWSSYTTKLIQTFGFSFANYLFNRFYRFSIATGSPRA